MSSDQPEPDRGFIRTFTIFVGLHVLYVIGPLLFTLAPFWLLLKGERILGTTFLCSYIAWFAFTYPSERTLGRPWPWFENLPVFKFIFDWFPFNIVRAKPVRHKKEDAETFPPLDPQGVYIFGVHPHGALAFHRGMFGFSTTTLWNRVFPGVNFRVLTATAALRVPIIREMWLWSYCVDASKVSSVPCAISFLLCLFDLIAWIRKWLSTYLASE